MSSTISALTNGTTVQSTDRIPAARSPYAPGDNVYLTPDELKAYATAPITLAFADVATETSAGNLIDGQMYNITGFPAFTSGVQLQDIYVYAHLDSSVVSPAVPVLDYECVANYSSIGNQNQVSMRYDWYTSQILSIADHFGNVIEGNTKCTNWPFGNSDFIGNKFGFDFVLNMTIAPLSIKNCVGLGNGTLTTIARDYNNINFDKGYFTLNFQFTFDGTLYPGEGSSIVIQKNETGDIPAIAHTAAGKFDLTIGITDGFGASVDKCDIFSQHVFAASTVTVTATYVNSTKIEIYVWDSTAATEVDIAVSNVSFQIQVYF